MIRTSHIVQYLKTLFPAVKFYNGTIDKTQSQCVGVYNRNGAGSPPLALGGKANTSYAKISISILVHWTENTDLCEVQAGLIYEALYGLSNVTIEEHRVIVVNLTNPSPISVGRTEDNIAEMVIPATLYYER